MYGGRRKPSHFPANQLAGPIIDRFGTDTMMIPKGAEHFTPSYTSTSARSSTGVDLRAGGGVKNCGPADVRDEYRIFEGKSGELSIKY